MVRDTYRVLMFSTVTNRDGTTQRVPYLSTGAIDRLEVWQAAEHLTPSTRDPSDMAVRSFVARQRGEKLMPASATTHAVHGDAIRAALAAHRGEER